MKLVSVACLLAGLLLAAAPAAAADPLLDLERADRLRAPAKMAAGELTSVQLTRAYVDRIAAVNARGPGINAVRIVNPRALQDASLLDLERATGHLRGPLHGVPVLVKDNLDVAGMPTTAGSVALQNSVPERDSTVVAKLRAAGAVILGKTNMTEFANFMTNGMPSGYSLARRAGAEPLRHRRLAQRVQLGRRPRPPRPASRRSRSAPRRRARSSRRPPRRAASACTRRSASSAAPASCRSPPPRTRRARSRARSPTPPRSCRRSPARIPRTRPPTARPPRSRTTSPGSRPRRWPASGSASSTTPTRSTRRPITAIQALGATTVLIPTPSPAQNFNEILVSEFKRDLNAYLSRLPASAPMKSLQNIIDYNLAHVDEALKFGQTQLTASQDVDLSNPATMRDLRRQPRRRPRRHPRGDRQRADHQHARRDHDPVGNAFHDRRARRLPADRRPGRLQRRHHAQQPGQPRAGRGRLQRHGLQRGAAAGLRLRLRAGDEVAQAGQRDQPGGLALLER